MTLMILIGGVVAVLSWFLTGLTLRILRKRAILDHPNERSSHSVPVPRGGGIPVVALTLILWAMPFRGTFDPATILLLAAAGMLAIISWIDDIRSLSPAIRLSVQCTAVLVGVYSLPSDGLLFQGLIPVWLDTVLICFVWLWFVNLFNFMDGIDAISGIEAITICGGLAILSGIYQMAGPDLWYSLTLGGGVIGFLWWNRPPAQIFLGDVGSITIGFCLGWLLINLAISGNWASAVILPLYYLSDATFTLIKRGLSGEKVWQAHREHFYQQAVQSGKSHTQVSGAILAANIGLIALAVLAVTNPFAALGLAFFVVFILIHWMRR
jgi:UDP-N-acetylmuramyl pentapeptide phosphotransferase/UDP-N-acetylglucosamine-1-phosphate transferase